MPPGAPAMRSAAAASGAVRPATPVPPSRLDAALAPAQVAVRLADERVFRALRGLGRALELRTGCAGRRHQASASRPATRNTSENTATCTTSVFVYTVPMA